MPVGTSRAHVNAMTVHQRERERGIDRVTYIATLLSGVKAALGFLEIARIQLAALYLGTPRAVSIVQTTGNWNVANPQVRLRH